MRTLDLPALYGKKLRLRTEAGDLAIQPLNPLTQANSTALTATLTPDQARLLADTIYKIFPQ